MTLDTPSSPALSPAAFPAVPRFPDSSTGALPGAPPQGEWFPEHFRHLLANAWPPLG